MLYNHIESTDRSFERGLQETEVAFIFHGLTNSLSSSLVFVIAWLIICNFVVVIDWLMTTCSYHETDLKWEEMKPGRLWISSFRYAHVYFDYLEDFLVDNGFRTLRRTCVKSEMFNEQREFHKIMLEMAGTVILLHYEWNGTPNFFKHFCFSNLFMSRRQLFSQGSRKPWGIISSQLICFF